MTTTPRAQRLVARAWIRKMANGESGGSQPHLFSTDDGEYMVKVLNNPQGSYVSVSYTHLTLPTKRIV